MSKAAGSGVTAMFSSNVPGLVLFGGSVAAGGAAFLIWVAWQMGFMFDDLMETGKVVGGEKEVSVRMQVSLLASSREDKSTTAILAGLTLKRWVGFPIIVFS